ncbi:uncharacterized protein PHACADRAFT_265970 [Phanerochaete carnosa HHB-10118-sp]|uniref:Uncharacterized protein n=1 Tax=Phanerochaete carnosa (strain HHB-10118-sp) TaxID=650164 RepID=K5WFI0_PHACS|nr:uncharacterized protein PHACADRAFT_265970 [Phanerochaete carnosa HHB-10118-sp]EKM48937.1 hypothetical protein PHACADRAFT_265970 [Phanerochaete carnosa HHB-10118-sp]
MYSALIPAAFVSTGGVCTSCAHLSSHLSPQRPIPVSTPYTVKFATFVDNFPSTTTYVSLQPYAFQDSSLAVEFCKTLPSPSSLVLDDMRISSQSNIHFILNDAVSDILAPRAHLELDSRV